MIALLIFLIALVIVFDCKGTKDYNEYKTHICDKKANYYTCKKGPTLKSYESVVEETIDNLCVLAEQYGMDSEALRKELESL